MHAIKVPFLDVEENYKALAKLRPPLVPLLDTNEVGFALLIIQTARAG